ncbi:MAG: hypothetical protein ACI9HK_000238 [Pirellulaceae bacterium]|jgi:hypothetical protein
MVIFPDLGVSIAQSVSIYVRQQYCLLSYQSLLMPAIEIVYRGWLYSHTLQYFSSRAADTQRKRTSEGQQTDFRASLSEDSSHIAPAVPAAIRIEFSALEVLNEAAGFQSANSILLLPPLRSFAPLRSLRLCV